MLHKFSQVAKASLYTKTFPHKLLGIYLFLCLKQLLWKSTYECSDDSSVDIYSYVSLLFEVSKQAKSPGRHQGKRTMLYKEDFH